MDEHDREYVRCAELIGATQERRIIPAPVLVELDYFLTRSFGPERFGEDKVATLDRRHFAVMRPRHIRTLELLPT